MSEEAKDPQPTTGRVVVYLAFPGETDEKNLLAETGQDQAREVAREIRKRAGDNRVVVLEPKLGLLRACYVQAAMVIADELAGEPHAPLCKGLYWDVRNLFDAQSHVTSRLKALFAALQRVSYADEPEMLEPECPRDAYVVLVIGETDGAEYLARFGGSLPQLPRSGPTPESVYEFVLTYDTATNLVADQRFA